MIITCNSLSGTLFISIFFSYLAVTFVLFHLGQFFYLLISSNSLCMFLCVTSATSAFEGSDFEKKSSCSALPYYCGHGLVLALLVGQSGATLGLI